jgi:hypothetical protein
LPEGDYLDTKLKGDTEIVVQGAQILLSEEFRARVQVGDQGDGD